MFAVSRSAIGWHVYPREGSVLDTEVALDGTEGPSLNALRRILSQIKTTMGTTSGTTITHAQYPRVVFDNKGVDVAVRDKASNVISMLLAATGRKVSWWLLYDPGQGYVLSAHTVGD